MAEAQSTGRTPRKRQPLYQQMVRSLRESIRQGELSPGSMAPSESELIARFRVSSTTARRALNELAQEGLVRRVQGKGSFITELAGVQATRHVGVLYHDLLELAGTFPTLALRGINEATERLDAQAVLMQFGQIRRSASPAAALRAMAEHYRLDAMLLLSPTPVSWLTEVLQSGMPVAAPNFAYDREDIISVTTNDQAAIARLVARFKELGHHNVAVLRGQFDPALVEGVRLSKPVLPVDAGIQWQVEHYAYFRQHDVRKHVAQVLANAQRPTAFLCWGYEAALTTVDELRQRGWRVPEDVSVAFVGVPPGPSQVSGEVVPIDAIAAAAVERLIGSVDASVAVTLPAVFEMNPQKGSTLGQAKG